MVVNTEFTARSLAAGGHIPGLNALASQGSALTFERSLSMTFKNGHAQVHMQIMDMVDEHMIYVGQVIE
jgi:hypothetical protein